MVHNLDVSLVCDLPPFMGMAEQEIADLLAQARAVRYPKGKNIFSQGEKAGNFFLLLDGHIQVVKLTQGGEQVVPRYMSPGELFGIARALRLDAYPASAVAAVDCVVLIWPNAIWDDLVGRHPAFATNTYRIIGQRLTETQQQLAELATAKVEQRVANAILKLAKQTGRRTDEGVLIDFPVSRQDISEMTGTTLHTVSRLLSAWEQAGWVRSGRRKITLVEGHKIVLVANGESGGAA
ncbi:MAG: Crp/Fnr family transcriptional regulator [Nitratireductor sp.]|nr:Crp/Fnr family transcriptional regulator [Nitratireductor sp.]